VPIQWTWATMKKGFQLSTTTMTSTKLAPQEIEDTPKKLEFDDLPKESWERKREREERLEGQQSQVKKCCRWDMLWI